MTTAAATYYAHARSLGAFKAADCLRLAREAAELDRARVSPVPPASTCIEHAYGTTQRLSFQIKVF